MYKENVRVRESVFEPRQGRANFDQLSLQLNFKVFNWLKMVNISMPLSLYILHPTLPTNSNAPHFKNIYIISCIIRLLAHLFLCLYWNYLLENTSPRLNNLSYGKGIRKYGAIIHPIHSWYKQSYNKFYFPNIFSSYH